MERHPYIGLYGHQVEKKGFRPAVEGIVAWVGTSSAELEVGAAHFPCALLLQSDGTHKEVLLENLIVDPAEAAARLAKHS